MNSRSYRLIQTAILFGLGVFLLYKIVSGTLYFYINQRFLWLSALGGLTFLLLAYYAWPRHAAEEHGSEAEHNDRTDHEHSERSRWTLFVLALPLLLGFLVPAKPLDSSALASRGLTTNALVGSANQQQVQLDQPSDQRTVLDWVRAFNYASDPSSLTGQHADVIGFVYHDDRLPDNQFLVGRFAITCCVADAFAVGVIVQSDDAQSWAGNTWVHVVGAVQVGKLDDAPLPLIVADSIKEVPVPPQPYLFP
jgi:uncharacterized repeat protein (TIGR03943 family)